MNTSHKLCIKNPTRGAHCAAGFTLPELMVVIALVAMLMAMAVPAVGSGLASLKLTSASNNLLFDIYLARSEAIKRNGRVVICKSADAATCATSGGWEQGAILFQDANNNGMRDDHEQIIQREPAFSRDLSISGNNSVAEYISYDSDGRSKLASGAFQAGTVTLCRHSGDPGDARQIVINADGRPRVQKTTVQLCP